MQHKKAKRKEKVMDDTTMWVEPDMATPEFSDWQCHLFGSNGDGISWRPTKGKEPNRFWRMMQYLCFGCKWVKEPVIKDFQFTDPNNNIDDF